jgi:hypothetical protein
MEDFDFYYDAQHRRTVDAGHLPDFDEEDIEEMLVSDRSEFQDPGGKSALRLATPANPRNLPCPTCGEPNKLTPKDAELNYQCDDCAERDERGGF